MQKERLPQSEKLPERNIGDEVETKITKAKERGDWESFIRAVYEYHSMIEGVGTADSFLGSKEKKAVIDFIAALPDGELKEELGKMAHELWIVDTIV